MSQGIYMWPNLKTFYVNICISIVGPQFSIIGDKNQGEFYWSFIGVSIKLLGKICSLIAQPPRWNRSKWHPPLTGGI